VHTLSSSFLLTAVDDFRLEGFFIYFFDYFFF
jgi:hypothetical protein